MHGRQKIGRRRTSADPCVAMQQNSAVNRDSATKCEDGFRIGRPRIFIAIF